MDGLNGVVVNIFLVWQQFSIGFFLIGCDKQVIGVYGNEVDIRGNAFQIYGLMGDFNRFEQLVHEFVSVELESLFEFAPVVFQPTGNLKFT